MINHGLGIISPGMSDESGGSKYYHQELGGSKSDHITIVLKNIIHICTQNKITVPFNNITRKIYMTQKCNVMH